MPEGLGKSDYVNNFLAYTYERQSYQPCQGRVAQARGTNQSSEVAPGLGDHKDFIRYLPEDGVVYCDMCGAPLCEECGNLGLCSTYAELWEAEIGLERAMGPSAVQVPHWKHSRTFSAPGSLLISYLNFGSMSLTLSTISFLVSFS